MLIPRYSPNTAASGGLSFNGASSTEDRVDSATWKIPAIQVAANACYNPNCHVHRTHKVHMTRTVKENSFVFHMASPHSKARTIYFSALARP